MTKYGESIDCKDPRIERDIGDAWDRVPHLVQSIKDGVVSERGVLYVPTSDGMWSMQAFANPTKAIAYLNKKFGDIK